MVNFFMMLTLAECRECLTTKVNSSLGDSDIVAIRDSLQTLSEVLVEFSLRRELTI